MLHRYSIKRLTGCWRAVPAVNLRSESKTSIFSNRAMNEGDVLGNTVEKDLGSKLGKKIFSKSGSDDASGQFSVVTLPITRNIREIWGASEHCEYS